MPWATAWENAVNVLAKIGETFFAHSFGQFRDYRDRADAFARAMAACEAAR